MIIFRCCWVYYNISLSYKLVSLFVLYCNISLMSIVCKIFIYNVLLHQQATWEIKSCSVKHIFNIMLNSSYTPLWLILHAIWIFKTSCKKILIPLTMFTVILRHFFLFNEIVPGKRKTNGWLITALGFGGIKVNPLAWIHILSI